METPPHSKISPTAKWVAQFRQYSDIPFARDVARYLKVDPSLQALEAGTQGVSEVKQFFAPFLEARYKGIRNAILRLGYRQVVELAAGISLRGLALAEQDPEIIYVETDLPGILEEKLEIVKKIRTQLPPNWFNVPVNVLDYAAIEKALQCLPTRKEVVIAHEGLMQYLSFPEKEILAKNVRRVLSERGGAWVTADLDTKETSNLGALGQERLKEFRKIIASVTERNLEGNTFENVEKRKEFFDQLGFRIEAIPMVESREELSSLKILQIDEKLSAQFPRLDVWVLRLK